MKNRKYTYKNTIPKALKQKKPGERRQGIQQYKKNSTFKTQSTWKLPMGLFVLSIIIIILIIPTLIVIPFMKDDKQEVSELDPETEKEQAQEVEQNEAANFSVAVMRNNSEEIENVPLETYVARVVASEMPANFEVEALKAQGLAARTYIVNHILYQKKTEEPDVTDTVEHQVYKDEEELRKIWGNDYSSNMKKLTAAVAATEGEILTHNSAPITPAFFSTSNGYTENSEDYWENELPYLRSVKSKWDEDSPKFLDQQVFEMNEVAAALNVNIPQGDALTIEVKRTDSNRVSELMLAGNRFTGREVREKLALQSSDFTIEQNKDHLIFTTKGYGHGIGMSQYGANGMAKEGKSYQDIVRYYYQDIEVSTVSEIAPTLVAK